MKSHPYIMYIIKMIQNDFPIMIENKINLFHFFFLPTEKHSLRYYITSSSGVKNLPEFGAQMLVDNLQGGWCDSNDNNQPRPRNQWAKTILKENPNELKYHMDSCVALTYYYRAYIKDLKQQFNQSGGKFKIIFPFYVAVNILMVVSNLYNLSVTFVSLRYSHFPEDTWV